MGGQPPVVWCGAMVEGSKGSLEAKDEPRNFPRKQGSERRATHTCAPVWEQRGPEAGHVDCMRISPRARVSRPLKQAQAQGTWRELALSPQGPPPPILGPHLRLEGTAPILTIHPTSTSPGTSTHRELSRESREKQGDI